MKPDWNKQLNKTWKQSPFFYEDYKPEYGDEFLDFFFGAAKHKATHLYVRRFESLFSVVESPIERAFLMSLELVARETAESIRYCLPSGDGYTFTGDIDVTWSRLTVYPQWKIKNYRVDFFLRYSEIEPNHNRVEKVGDKDVIGTDINYTELVVECDGHEFHERTKEQAAHDRKRDRVLQEMGYTVFRFTGSEIWKDAFSCAKSVMDAICGNLPSKRKPLDEMEKVEVRL